MAQTNYTPISLYYSTTASAVPTAANLVPGELAINTNDGKLYYEDSSGVVQVLASKAGALGDVVGPASATDNALARFDLTTGKLIQNSIGILTDAGALSGLTGLTSSGSITLSSLTSGRVTYAGASGLLSDSANFTYDASGNLLLSGTVAATTTGGMTITNTSSGSSSTPLALRNAGTANGSGVQISFRGVTNASAENDYAYFNMVADDTTAKTGSMRFSTANGSSPAERMRITSAGNVGIGTSSPNYQLHVTTSMAVGASGFNQQLSFTNDTIQSLILGTGYTALKLNPLGGDVLVGTTSTVDSAKVQISGAKVLSSGIPQGQLNILDSSAMAASVGGAIAFSAQYQSGLYTTMGSVEGIKENATAGQYGGSLVFRTRTNFGDNNERMRIDSSGNLLVGATSAVGKFTLSDVTPTGTARSVNYASSGGTIDYYIVNSINVGSISCTTSLTSYNVTSDYRLKENIVPMTGALAKVAQLNPVTYKWKIDGVDGEGFIAHELAEVVPQCVTGEKDAIDKDGKPKYQAMDTSHLIATLTAAIQEQQALIESLTTRLTALENK